MADLQVEPHLFVILGGTGDLMRRKLFPALYRLIARGRISYCCYVLAVGRRTSFSDDSFRAWAREALAAADLPLDDGGVPWCDRCLHYHSIGDGTPEDYRGLAERILAVEREHDLPQNRVFYVALPPEALPDTIAGLGQAGLSRAAGWTRVVVEKPFGRDLASAQDLNRLLHAHFDESQTYRIDHYLGKETVQNLLVFRFANPIFESLWNRERVRSVHITVAESAGVGTRGDYYENVGALRDMVQNHLTQLLALMAMEVPVAFEADAIRDEKAKVLRSVAPIEPQHVVFGQYARGQVGEEEVPGYVEEERVAPDSRTETFVAMRLSIANWRWQGVPFYLRTGKRLRERCTCIIVTFRPPPLSLFCTFEACEIHSNVLVMTIEPDEGFDLAFEIKAPGEPFSLQTHRLHFRHADVFPRLREAYETLLLDIIRGDQTLFVRADEVETAWRLYTPLLGQGFDVHPYPAGSWGPPAAGVFPRGTD